MISRVGLKLFGNSGNSVFNDNKGVNYHSKPMTQTKLNSLTGDTFVSFGASEEAEAEKSKLKEIMYSADASSKNLIKDLKQEAKNSNYPRITPLHVLRHGLVEADKYIETLKSGKKEPKIKPPMVDLLNGIVNIELFTDKNYRDEAQEVIRKHIKQVDNLLNEEKPKFKDTSGNITFSEDLVDSIIANQKDLETDIVTPWLIMQSALTADDETSVQFVEKFLDDLAAPVMRNNKKVDDREPFSDYVPKAAKVLKNIELGTNNFLTYDEGKVSANIFLDTIFTTLKKKYGNKFEYVELNHNTKADYYASILKEAEDSPDKEYIVAFCPSSVISLSGVANDSGKMKIPPELMVGLLYKPENVKYILYDTTSNYSSLASNSLFLKEFANYAEMAIPAMNTEQMLKYYKENPTILKDVKKNFSKNAIERAIEVSSNLDGVYPDKTKDLMNKIATYYTDKKDINERDVENYLTEASGLLKKEASNSSIDIVFDTGKRIKDLVGKGSTQKEAALLVKQIKSGKMGTKGVVLYSQDGYPGAGRRFTAKAIAGEAHIPFVEINAVDFGTKEVDLFGAGNLSPEMTVKQLFNTIKTQAESNPNRAAMLFIENFEYFSVGEKVSLYHEKAMAQLLREMDKASAQGLNILVAGSVSDPQLIGEATMKSFKFVDTIEVSSPAYSKGARIDIIEKTLKSSKIKIAGSKDEKENVISYVSDIANGLAFIEIKSLIKKATTVAQERGRKALTKADFTEAYLQMLTGRASVEKIPEHERKIVASHECGHATNLEVMNNITKTIGKPWQVPAKVNFITLDPRGIYGGAVFHGDDTNAEVSFENVFSGIVCSFGGNSAENLFYGMDGSYGISSDMESVRKKAEIMVKVMGLGAKTGKMSIARNEVLSDKMKQRIEDDERVIINNAKITSDLITEMYSDFNVWFTKKYAPLVGTGDCIMDGDVFRKALKQWRLEQSPQKQEQLQACDEVIVKIMEATKRGIAVQKKD